MSTRSRIAVEQEDGTVLSVYCHNDGYVSGVGSELLNMFPNGTDVTDVINYIKKGDRTTVGMSYKEWRDEDCPNDTVGSLTDFFEGDIEEYGYLYTFKKEWLVKASYASQAPPNRLEELV